MAGLKRTYRIVDAMRLSSKRVYGGSRNTSRGESLAQRQIKVMEIGLMKVIREAGGQGRTVSGGHRGICQMPSSAVEMPDKAKEKTVSLLAELKLIYAEDERDDIWMGNIQERLKQMPT